jgi:hypothetical protein
VTLVLAGVGNSVTYKCMITARSFTKICDWFKRYQRDTGKDAGLVTNLQLFPSKTPRSMYSERKPQAEASNAYTLPLCQYKRASVHNGRIIKRPIWPAECPRRTPWAVNSTAEEKTSIQGVWKLAWLRMVTIQYNSTGIIHAQYLCDYKQHTHVTSCCNPLASVRQLSSES